MTVIETIFNFIMTYIFYISDPAEIGIDYIATDFMSFFTWVEGADGRLIWEPFSVYSNLSNSNFILSLVAFILSILACISLCVMLWKLITLPIRYFSNRVK